MAPAKPDARGSPYEPIDANQPRYGTEDERQQALSEVLLWGWSALVVFGAAFGVHEVLASGSLHAGYLVAGSVVALLVGATEFHLVCNVLAPSPAAPRTIPVVAAIFCIGFLFVFTHVAVVSLLGTPRIAQDAWFRSVTAANSAISTRLQSIEFSLEQVFGTQLVPRGEEDVSNDGTPADTGSAVGFAAALGHWNDAFAVHAAPLKSAIDAFPREAGSEPAEEARADDVARALATFSAQIRRTSTTSGFGRYLDNPASVEDPVAQRHLRAIAAEVARIDRTTIAQSPRDRSAGVDALGRLGGAAVRPFGVDATAGPLTTRDCIGLGVGAIALLFTLLLQVNRWRFHATMLPDPPDSLSAHEHRT